MAVQGLRFLFRREVVVIVVVLQPSLKARLQTVLVVALLALSLVVGLAPTTTAQGPAPAEALLNGSFEGLATDANGFSLHFDGAALSGAATDGTQSVDLGAPGPLQPWSALGAVRAGTPPSVLFGELEGLTFAYNVPSSLATAPGIRFQTYLNLDLDRDGVRDHCIVRAATTPLAQTTGWTTYAIDRQAEHHDGGADCAGASDDTPLAAFQAQLGAARVMSLVIQTIADSGPWPAGLPILVDAVALTATATTGAYAAPTTSATVCGGGSAFAKIQDAIDCSAPSGLVLVPVGTYAESLVIDTNLLGSALDGLTVCSTDAAASACVLTEAPVVIEGTSAAAPVVDVLANDVTLDHLTLLGGDPVVRAADNSGFTLRQSVIEMGPFGAGTSTGVSLVRSDDASVFLNAIAFPAQSAGFGGTARAVSAIESDRVHVTSNDIVGDLHPASTAIHIAPVMGGSDGGSGHRVGGNTITGTQSGVRIDSASDVVVNSNRITDNGIGIDLIDVADAWMTTNVLTATESDQVPPDFLSYGVFVRGGSSDYRISVNEIRGYQSGVYVGGSAGGPGEIHDNTIANGLSNGILLEGTRPNDPIEVRNNVFQDNRYQAVRLDTNRPLTLRENHFLGGERALTANLDPARFPDLVIDARLNHWGIDSWRLLPMRAEVQDTQTLLQIPFLDVTGNAEPGLPTAVPASHSTTPATCDAHPDAEFAAGRCVFLTVQAAIDFAHPGGTVYVPASQSLADPTPYVGAIGIDTNNDALPETLDGLTVCGSLGGALCAADIEPGHWQTQFQERESTAWEQPPSPLSGQAVRIDMGLAPGYGSTSYFPPDGMQIADIERLAWDQLQQWGSCGGGAPRISLGIDTNGDGTRDANVEVTSATLTASCLTSGWQHIEMLDLADLRWNSAALGGPSAGTQADAQSAAQTAAAANGADHQIAAVNLGYDAGGGRIWFDNQIVNKAFLGEQIDESCVLTATVTCRESTATASTIIDGTGAADIVTVNADDVTLKGLSIRHTGAPAAPVVGVRLGGVAGPVIADNRIVLEGGGCPVDPNAACYSPFQVTGIAGTSTGAVIERNEIAADLASPTGDGTIGGTNGILGGHSGATIEANQLRAWRANAMFLWGADTLIASNNFRGNSAHVLLCSGADRVQVLANEFLASFEAVATCGDPAPVDLKVSNNQMGLTNGLGLVTRAPSGPLVADFTCNDWGVYNGMAIRETRVRHDNGQVNLVQTDPFTSPDGASFGCLLAPVADFTASTLTPIRDERVDFTDASTPGSRPILLMEWDFGDGATDIGPEVDHAYSATGVYDVTLRVQDADGMTSTVVKQVLVQNLVPGVTISGGPTIGEAQTLGLFIDARDPDGDAVTITASGVPTGAVFEDHGDGTAHVTWTPPAGSAGSYPMTFTATDSIGGTDAGSITVVVIDSLGPVDFTDVVDVTIVEGYSVTHKVHALDDTGDPITLAASGLPLWASFSDLGGGTGRFAFGPSVGTATTTVPVTITATAGADTESRTFSVTVVPRADIELFAVGTNFPVASPGEALPVDVEVRNVGLSGANVQLSAGTSKGWAVSTPSTVWVGPLTSVFVTMFVTPDFDEPQAILRLDAEALGFPGERAMTQWRIDVPAFVDVAFEVPPGLTESVRGEATARFANGDPAVGLDIVFEQSPPPVNPLGVLTSGAEGTTDATGAFAFDLGADPLSRLPGEHAFHATVQYGDKAFSSTGTYTIGVL